MPGCDRDWSGSWRARTVPLMALRAPTEVSLAVHFLHVTGRAARLKGTRGNSSRGRQLGLALLVPAFGACACADAGPSGSNHAPPAGGHIAKPLVANALRNLKTVGRRNAQLIGSFTGRAQGESTSPPP